MKYRIAYGDGRYSREYTELGFAQRALVLCYDYVSGIPRIEWRDGCDEWALASARANLDE